VQNNALNKINITGLERQFPPATIYTRGSQKYTDSPVVSYSLEIQWQNQAYTSHS